jgi:hypothetical protein
MAMRSHSYGRVRTSASRSKQSRLPGPTTGDLDAIARRLTASNCGVRTVVRVVEEMTVPAYYNSGEPVCEDMPYRWR